MKKIFFAFSILLSGYVSIGQNLDQHLAQAVSDNNFFLVRSLLSDAKGKLPAGKFLFYNALAENKFDHCESSNKLIEEVFRNYQHKLPDSLLLILMDVKVSNALRLYRYKSAVQTSRQIMKNYRQLLDSAEVNNYQNMLGLFGALSEVPPQEMHLISTDTIDAYRNKFNHLMVPVKAKDTTANFIFDSGAGLSTINESYAKKMGMRMIESKIDVNSGTSIKVQSKLAVADSIFVGDILFRHVVFLVMPDSVLSFPQVNLVIKGIIGFPVLHQMGEIHMFKDGKIVVAKTPAAAKFQNLFLDNQVPIVAIIHDGDTLLLNLDTGAKTTELSKKFYDAHKVEVDSLGKRSFKHFGSAGGIVQAEVSELPNFRLTVGCQKVTLPNVTVMLEEKKFTKGRDGNFGQDVIGQFNEMVLSFRNMYVDFKR